MKKRFVQAFVLAIVGALAMTGCGNKFKDNYYRPASFGENSQCYYINDPAEAVMLQREGFCDSNWRPVMAPTYWQARYSPYYSSAEYRDYYVPAGSRARYDDNFRTFNTRYATVIVQEQSKAQYKDNKGTVVDGNKVPRGQFGGGVRSKGGAGIRGDNGKSFKKNHDDVVKKVQKEQKKQQDSKTNKSNPGKGSGGGGIRNGGSSGGSKSGSSSGGSKSSSGRR